MMKKRHFTSLAFALITMLVSVTAMAQDTVLKPFVLGSISEGDLAAKINEGCREIWKYRL